MSNLDDFFKKRDKKKKTTKSKFSTLDTEELVKNLEASTSKADDESEFQENGERPVNLPGNDNLDEEWKPFETDENKDYSGLRINIQNWKVEDENDENSSAIEENEKKPHCPWAASLSAQNKIEDNTNRRDVFETKQGALSDSTNQKPASLAEAVKAGAATTTADEEEAETKPTDSKASSTGAAPSAYLPPHLRRQQVTTSSAATTTTATGTLASGAELKPFSVSASRKSNKSQPNINDTFEFPTLDAAVVDSSEKANVEPGERFDFPKKATRPDSKTSGKNLIDLSNKFNALSTNN